MKRSFCTRVVTATLPTIGSRLVGKMDDGHEVVTASIEDVTLFGYDKQGNLRAVVETERTFYTNVRVKLNA